MRFWRICRRPFANTAFSGEGAKITGGRWNSPGIPLAYATENLSLAVLELFVHVDPDEVPEDLVAIHAEFPINISLVEEQKRKASSMLSKDWQFNLNFTRSRGDAWCASRDSIAMWVPSVLIDVEWNVLINPLHEQAKEIRVLEIRPFRFDTRMFKNHS